MQNRVAVLLFLFFLLGTFSGFSQIGTDFSARLLGGNVKVKGDVVLIGNTILTPLGESLPYNGTKSNNELDAVYLDVDSDGSTTSSSRADLAINNSCKKIIFAGLYWSAMYPNGSSTDTNCFNCGTAPRNDWNVVKFKVPGATTYTTLTADKADPKEVIFKGNNTNVFNDGVYVCFKDVTNLLQPLTDADGSYTVADLRATTGKRRGGSAGGWVLVVIYESPSLPSKFISVFDGARMTNVDAGSNQLLTVDIPIIGFQALPSPFSVIAKIGVAALDGDYDKTGDGLSFREGVPPPATPIAPANSFFTSINNPLNPSDNFFNATITNDNAHVVNRNPNSRNNLGFDIDQLQIPNALNAVIHNDATQGTLRLTTNTTGGDGFAAFVTTFAIDIIEPNVKLTKKVINAAGADITNQQVNLGDELRYVIGFENIGSDKAKDVYIEDYLPNIILFNPPTSFPYTLPNAVTNDVLSLPNGVSVYSYDPAALDPHDNVVKRKIVFKIDESLVDLLNDQERFIIFKVKVPTECKDFSDACSNEVTNIAYSKYTGEENKGAFGSGSQPPSVACALGDIATNFIGNIDGCLFDTKYTLCGNNVTISGRNGFQNYTWTGPNGFVASGKTINVSKVGDYIVKAQPIAPCLKSLEQKVTVELYSNTDTDALLKYAANLTPNGPISDRGEIVQCDIDGKKMPHIFLCGAGDHRDMSITNSAVVSVDWYQLSGAACIATAASNNGECANEDLACWTLLQTSKNYSANTAGYFKAIVRYDNGCFNTLYFNVYKNDLNPTASSTSIICTKPGTMTVAGIPASGYEYSFNVTGYTGVKTYTSGPNANVFSTTTPQNYTASIRQIGVTDGCIFTVSAQIDLVDFKIDAAVTQPTCTNVNGSIKVTAPAGATNYEYTLSKSGVGVIQPGTATSATNITFLNQSPGTYSVNVKTSEGCDVTVNNIVINALTTLTATAVLTKPVTCTDGEITIYPVGGTPFTGTPPYYLYSVNGAPSVSNPVIPITLPLTPGGLYKIEVVDQNNCNAETSITVAATPKPVYSVETTNILCNGSNTGVIKFVENSNAGAYPFIDYSIDGINFFSTPVFSNLSANTVYTPVVRYTKNKVDFCTEALTNITLTAPAAINAIAEITTPYTCDSPAVISVTSISGGTGPYNYTLNRAGTAVLSNTTGVFNINGVGSYTVSITDSKGCPFTTPALTVSTLNGPTDLTFTYKSFDCSTNTSAFNVNLPSSGGGQTPVRFKIIALPAFIPVGSALYNYLTQEHSDGQYSGVPAGSYTFEVTDKNNCKYQEIYDLSPEPPIVVTGKLINNVRCLGSATGSVEFSISGFATTYTYSINGGAVSGQISNPKITLNNLVAGDYTITVTDKKTGCVRTAMVSVLAPTTQLKIASIDTTAITCLVSGGAVINTTGGWGINSYTVTGTTPVVAAVTQSSNDFKNLTAGNYTASVTDVNGCIVTQNFTISALGGPTASIVQNTGLCFDASGATITVKVTGGVGPFSYKSIFNGGTPSASSATFTGPDFTFNATVIGTYSFEVTDSNGCKASTLDQVISDKLTASTNVLPGLDCEAAPLNQAVITGTIFGGTAPFSVTILSGDTTGSLVQPAGNGTSFTYNTVVSGAYSFQIKDANNCLTTIGATLNPLVAVTGSVTNAVNPTCYNGTDGQIQLAGGGGSGGYKYSFNGSAFTSTSLYTLLNAKTTTANTTVYSYQIQDSNGCLSPVYTVTLNNPAEVVASASIPANTACSSTAVITVVGAGGAGGYTYSFGIGAYTGVNTLSVNLTAVAQTITYSVKDSKGCTDTETITIPAYNPPTGINFSTPAAITCLATTTSVTLTPKVAAGAAVAPFTYVITAGPGSATSNNTGASTGIFTGLLPGTYSFQVTDANGCKASASLPIAAADVIAVAGSATDETCFGLTDGTAKFTITGASSTGNFDYTLTPSSGTILQTGDVITVTGLAANTYTLIAKDKTTGCDSNTASVTINPATVISITGVTASNVSCNQSISNIVVTATGGLTSYKYAYVIAGSGQPLPAAFSTSNTTINTGATQSNLSWDVYIMDQNDCIAGPFNKIIGKDASPSVKSPAPAPFCFVAPSSTAIDVSTFFNLGTGVHTYTVNGTTIVGTSYNITGSGTYTIVAKDANGCPATATYVVKPELTILATRVKDLDCISNGQITFVASNGTSPYSTYEVQFNGAGAWSTVTSPYSTAVAGDYQFRVTDSAGCQGLSNIITITPKTTPTYSHNETQISCIGGTNGVINITSPTGIAPFTYLISNGGATVSTTSTASDLSAGTYDIVVTDSKGCPSLPFSITLANPTALSATVNSTPLACGVNNATVGATITVTSPAGGSGGYEYSFNGGAFSSTPTYTTTLSGLVTVTMRDSNHCPQPLTSQNFVALNPPTLKPITGTTLLCSPAASTTSTVTVAANVGTGVGTLSYALVSGPMASNTGDINGVYTGLIAGTYVFKVTDENGCSASDSYTVKPLASITSSLFSQVDVKCNGASTGSATINVSGFTAGNTYKATLVAGTGTVNPVGSTASGTVNVTGLVQGVYTLRVIDDVTSCSSDVNFTITQPSPLTLAIASNKNANCTQPLSKVTVTAGGGKLAYSYAFISTTGNPNLGDYTASVGTSFSADLDPVTPTWYAWVKDANGCETSLTVNIVKDADPSITLPAQQCFVGTPFSITLSGTGAGTLIYSVNGSPISGNTYNITAAGTYKLGVTDANNCTDVKDYIVEKQLLATAILDKDITCSVPTAASITVNITNGTAPFSYQIYNGAATVGSPVTGVLISSFTENLITTPGNYSFEITDSKGCIVKTNTLAVVPKVDPVMNPVTLLKPILCKGESTAEITVTYDNTKGTSPFVINVKQYLEAAHTTLVKDFGTQTSGLPAGFYVVSVIDAKGCSAKENFDIIEPGAITVSYTNNPITCVTGSGLSKGSIVVNAAGGGSGNFIYQVSKNGTFVATQTSNGLTPVTFDLIDFGNYELLVTDANGCSWVKQNIPIASPPASLTLAVTPSTPVCGALGSAEVKVGTPEPGSVGFFFAMYKPGIFYTAGDPDWLPEDGPNSLKATISNLIPGVTYTFVVFDDTTKCYYYKTFTNTVPSATTITATATAIPVTCKLAGDGSVNLKIESTSVSAITVNYEIYNSDTLVGTGITGSGSVSASSPLLNAPFVATPALLPGTYFVLITEPSGCTQTTAPFSITESAALVEISASSSKNDNCNTNAGVITAIGKKGTGPYTYAIVPKGALQPATIASGNTFQVESGDWDVYVKDTYGCVQHTDVTVLLDPTPGIATITPSSTCYTGTAITVTITPSATILGPVTYSVDKGALIGSYGSSASFALTPGTYTLNVKDGNGCIASAPYIIKEQLTLTPTLTKGLDCLTASPNATVTVKAEGGNTVLPATYAYTITAPAAATGNLTGATTGIFTGLDAGNYTFEVSDGTCTATTTITINALVPIVPTKTVGTPLCVGGNASVEIKATGGTGFYEYSKGALGGYSTTNIFTQSVAEGTVTYYVKDSKGCVQTIDAVVTDPTPIAVPVITVNQMTCGTGNLPNAATITVTTSGGTGVLQYSFDNGTNYTTNNIYTTTIAGTYQVIVKDANECPTVMQSSVIDALDPPVITGFTKTQMTCPALVSDVTILHTNGIAPLAFKLVSGPTMPNTTGDISGTYTGLAAGDYMFRITDKNGCIAERLYTVPTVPTLQLVPQVVANVNCNGGTTGSATFTASGLFASGAFTVSPVVTTPAALPSTVTVSGDVVTLTGLAKGQYEVTITDTTTLCSITKSVTITEPALPLGINAVASNVNCNDAISQLTMTPTGGTPNYTYSIVQSGAGAGVYSNSTSIDTSTLGAGTSWLVDVHIKDANNCTAMTTITITKDVTPTVTTTALATNQCTANGNYTFTATGTGIAPLSFSIDGTNFFTSAGTTYTFTVSAPTGLSQAYTVTIKDKNGCTATSTTQTTVYKPLTLNVVQDKDITCAALPITGAQFTLTAGDGNPAYTYAVDINGGGFNTISSPYTTSAIGTYVFRVTDANNCTVTSAVFNVTAPVDPAIVSTPIIQAILCVGGSATMQVNVNPLTGVAPYTYTVTQTLPAPGMPKVQVSNNIFTGLLEGSYEIRITDAIGCTSVIATQVISDPAVLSATVDPFPVKAACDVATVITVVGHGGTPTASGGYYYNFNGEGYTTTNTYTVNDNGISDQTISFTVKDANGCVTASQTVTVNRLDKPTDLDFSATPIYCDPIAKRTSTVTLTTTNGYGTLTYTMLPSLPVGVTQPAANEFAGLLPGDYTFQVTDSNGCSYEELYTVKDVVKIDVTGQLVEGVVCNSDANGKVTFTVSGVGALGFTHTITGVSAPGVVTQAGNTFELTNLVSGTYQIDVIDTETGCTDAFSVFVPEPALLGVSYATVKNANCILGTTIKATASNGTPGYTYAFVKTGDPIVYSTNDTAILDPAFTWTVWAKDAHLCEVSTPITIITDPMPQIDSVTATQCPTAAGYDITVLASSGVGTLEYSLDGNSFQSSNVLKVTSPGNYTVTVRDANLCPTNVNGAVSILKPLTLSADVSKVRSCSVVADGEVTLTAYDGSGNYEYSKDGLNYFAGPSANIFGGLAAGTHTFYVHDLDTASSVICVKSVAVIIEEPTQITGMALSKVDVTCQGGSDGSIKVALDPSTLTVNNNPDYNFSLTGTTVNSVAVTRGNQLTKDFYNLEAGSYTITTTSSRGCQYSEFITVGEPGIISVPAPAVIEYACSTASPSNTIIEASITVNNVIGGSGTYSIYEFVQGGLVVQSGVSNIYTQTDLSGGTFTINVYDNNGCIGTTSASIKPYVSIDFDATAAITVTKAITCVSAEDIQVNVNTTGVSVPMPTLSYNIKGISLVYTDTNTTGLFTGLAIGSYLVTVVNPDTGCSVQTIHYVNNPNTFDLQVVNKSDVICYGSNEGSVELTFIDSSPLPTDDSGPYSYEIKDATGTIVRTGNSTNVSPELITGLTAGAYSVTATLTGLTSSQCTTPVSNFIINQPDQTLAISETHTPVTCLTANSGTISAAAIGGWSGGYEFQLELASGTVINPWSATGDFTGLAAGNYIVKARDSKGCPVQTTVNLVTPTAITAAITANKTLSCSGDTDVIITVGNVLGGSGNYDYTLEATYPDGKVTLNGPQQSKVFANLGAASYRVIVSDTWSCSVVTNTWVISEPSIVTASLVGTSIQTCMNPATVTLSAVGGTGPYSYSADSNFATVLGSFVSSTTFSVPFTTVAVDHFYYVKDNNGCVSYASNSTRVVPLEPLDFKFINDAPYISCNGDTSGEIIAVASGGQGNYTYTLLDSASNPILTALQPTPGYFKGLSGGVYFVEVTSGDCTITPKRIEITQPATALAYTAVATPVTCNGYGNGKLVLTASGGTGIIKYALSPNNDKFVDDGTFLNLNIGPYTAIIQDERGCKFDHNFVIDEPTAIAAIVDPTTVQQALCKDDKASFDITIAGGVAPYSTSIDRDAFVLNRQSFSGLSGGMHTVIVKDANSCEFRLDVLLNLPAILNPSAVPVEVCEDNLPVNRLIVNIDPSNNPADVMYSLDGIGAEQASNEFKNLAPGDHYVMVHHTKNNCFEATEVFTIDKIDPLSLSIELGKLNEIVFTATGGTEIYQFEINGQSLGSNNKFIYFKSGDYEVKVTDSHGCTATARRHFDFIDIKIPPIFTPTGDGTNDTWRPLNTENYPDVKFVVYDRYGRQVGTFGSGQSWDGKYNGTELPMGDYWYVLKLRHSQDDREFIGHFTLYR